jgi:hypothetical protein
MIIKDIVKLLDCEILTPRLYHEDKEINFGFCSDLMSDALMILNTVKTDGVLEKSILITGLATNQAVRTAEMLDVDIILMVRDKTPSDKVIMLAEHANICILKTQHTMFNSAGLLYHQGMRGIVKHD